MDAEIEEIVEDFTDDRNSIDNNIELLVERRNDEEEIIYLNGTLNEPEVEIKGPDLYLQRDKKETLCIFIPEKYRDECEIFMNPEENYLMNFYNHLDIIREQKLTLRDITLNHILVFKILYRNKELIELYLNLGLNPYLYFNDYYVSDLNSININEPILTFKRHRKFNPFIDEPIKFIDKTRILINKDDIIDVEYFKEKYSNCISYFDNEEQYVYISQFTINWELENRIQLWKVEKEESYSNSKIFLISKMLSKLKKNIYINNSNILETDNHNLLIWKYGTIDYPTDKKEFEWLYNTNIYKEFELVKKHTIINNEDIKNIVGKNFENLDYEHKYKKQALDNIYYEEMINKIKNKLKTIGETSFCSDEIINNNEIKFSNLRNIINEYIFCVQDYLLKGNHVELNKYIKREELFNKIFEEDKIYQKLLNNGIFSLLEEAIDNYDKEVINNEQFELQMPDIYILLGFYIYPYKFSKELWDKCNFSKEIKWKFIIKSLNFLETTGWYYMYGLCCFFAQVIGPSYYIYYYYIIENNEYCPNNSLILNKFFAIAYYLVLYARMNSFWRSLTTTVWQYGNTTLITHDNYLRLTLFINSLCLYIIPIFTYTLFIELSGITDLILNCLTGEFLVNIDNLIVEFIGENNYIKTLTKDLLLFSFIDTGFPRKNIMEGNTIELWIITLSQVIQMLCTLIFTVFVYRCI